MTTLYCGDKTQFYDLGLEEQDEQTIFCPNGHAPRRIPVEFNLRWKSWEPVDANDIACPICGADGEM